MIELNFNALKEFKTIGDIINLENQIQNNLQGGKKENDKHKIN